MIFITNSVSHTQVCELVNLIFQRLVLAKKSIIYTAIAFTSSYTNCGLEPELLSHVIPRMGNVNAKTKIIDINYWYLQQKTNMKVEICMSWLPIIQGWEPYSQKVFYQLKTIFAPLECENNEFVSRIRRTMTGEYKVFPIKWFVHLYCLYTVVVTVNASLFSYCTVLQTLRRRSISNESLFLLNEKGTRPDIACQTKTLP